MKNLTRISAVCVGLLAFTATAQASPGAAVPDESWGYTAPAHFEGECQGASLGAGEQSLFCPAGAPVIADPITCAPGTLIASRRHAISNFFWDWHSQMYCGSDGKSLLMKLYWATNPPNGINYFHTKQANWFQHTGATSGSFPKKVLETRTNDGKCFQKYSGRQVCSGNTCDLYTSYRLECTDGTGLYLNFESAPLRYTVNN